MVIKPTVPSIHCQVVVTKDREETIRVETIRVEKSLVRNKKSNKDKVQGESPDRQHREFTQIDGYSAVAGPLSA